MIKLTPFEPEFGVWINPDEIAAFETYAPPFSEHIDLSIGKPEAHTVVLLKMGKAFRVKETVEQILKTIEDRHVELFGKFGLASAEEAAE